MASNLLSTLQSDLKQAQLARNAIKISTLRLLLSEINNTRISLQADLTDQDMMAVVQREIKKRKEAAEGFRSGGRVEQAEKEEKEAEILQTYLPIQLEDEELTKVVESSITELGAKSLADIGRVMGVVMGKVSGRADGGRVSNLVKEKLSS